MRLRRCARNDKEGVFLGTLGGMRYPEFDV